jgi:hypothetical protein
MALFTDGDWITSQHLQAYEASVLDVAGGEGIDLDTKIALAADLVSDEVLTFLLEHETQDPKAPTRRSVGVSDVVITTALRRWITMQALSWTFQDAYHNQLNDRFRAKWSAYERLAFDAKAQTWRQGIGLALNPIARSMTPVVSSQAGVPANGTVYLRVTQLNASGAEGAPSPTVAVIPLAGEQIVLRAAALEDGCTGWHLYAGYSADSIARQSSAPLSTNESWIMPGGGLVGGKAPGDGPRPDVFVTGGFLFRRG